MGAEAQAITLQRLGPELLPAAVCGHVEHGVLSLDSDGQTCTPATKDRSKRGVKQSGQQSGGGFGGRRGQRRRTASGGGPAGGGVSGGQQSGAGQY